MLMKNPAAVIALLSWSIVAAAQFPAEPTLTPISAGQTKEAALGEGDFRYPNGAFREDYEISAAPGSKIDVVFASTNLYPDLAVGVDDDGGCRDGCKTANGLDAAVRLFPVPANGKVRVRLVSSFPGSVGPYSLSILSGGTAAPEVARQEETLIAVGQAMAGELATSDPKLADGRPYDVFMLSHKAGQSVQVTVRSTDFDAVMVAGPLVAEGRCISISGSCIVDDDSGGGRNPRITTTIPPSGYLWISVTGQNANAARGAYSIEVMPTPAAATARPDPAAVAPVATAPSPVVTASTPLPAQRLRRPKPTQIALGKTVSGTLSADDGQRADGGLVDFYEFRAPAGTRVKVVMVSSSFTPVMSVGTSGSLDCTQPCQSVEAGADGKAQVGNIVVSGMELVRIVVGSRAPDGIGAYTLSVSPEP